MFYISALYKFYKIANPNEMHNEIRKQFYDLNIKGTILVGNEGINGTISSQSVSDLDSAIEFIKSYQGLKDIDLKYSESEVNPFVRLKIKLKKEIVTIGDESINPNHISGEYVDPNNWNKLISDKNVITIDTRNSYECSIGTFENSINPGTTKFR